MTKELEQKLIEKYPELFVQHNLPMTQTCLCWGLECGDGWFELIDLLCHQLMQPKKQAEHTLEVAQKLDHSQRGYWTPERLEEQKAKLAAIVVPQFSQIKEKFGTLRIYMDHADETAYALVDFAEDLSGKICEECGNKGKNAPRPSWWKTLCEECAVKLNMPEAKVEEMP